MANDNTRSNLASDLQDPPKDQAKMKPESGTIDLPDVNDIPGQENIIPQPLGELADTTAASADEEADSLFKDDIGEGTANDPNVDVSEAEKEDLKESAVNMPTNDNINLRAAALDNTDDDGTPLNEESFGSKITGGDLDIPGAEQDDENEEIGEEDEENNAYSLGGDNHDDIPEDNF